MNGSIDISIPVARGRVEQLSTAQEPQARLYALPASVYALQIFARRRTDRGMYTTPFVATAELGLGELCLLCHAAIAAIAELATVDSTRALAALAELSDAASGEIADLTPPAPVEGPAEDPVRAMSRKGAARGIAMMAAMNALRAVRITPSTQAPDGHPYAWWNPTGYAWYAITPDAMAELGEFLENAKRGGARAAHPRAIIEAWAQADKTAIALPDKLQKQLTRREKGR